MELLLILLLVLLVIMAVGHGLWLAVAWILRGGRSRSSGRDYEPTLSDDRAATARYLGHLRSAGVVDEETHSRLMRLLAEESRPTDSIEAFLDRRRAGAARAADEGEVQPHGDEPRPASVRGEHPRWSCAGCGAENASTLQTCSHCGKSRWMAEAEGGPAAVEPAGDVPAAPAGAAEPEAEAVPTSRASAAPREPRRPLSELLAAFMAEKNIRWGELVGGLLIVGSSTALVISLWSQIAAIPLLKFIIFTAVTAALFGAGLFVYHRWKLPTTGHALLVISTLLVPLNLLAFAAFSQPRSLGGASVVAATGAAVALFGWLSLLAGRVVMPEAPWLFAGGVTGLSACSLVMRFVFPTVGAALVTTSLAPIGLYVVVMALSLWRRAGVRPLGDEHAKSVVLQLGVQTFACLVPVGLLLYQTGAFAATVRQLSPMACAFAVPALGTGLYLWCRLPRSGSPQLRTAAASIALVAIAVMVLGAGLAWPVPSRLMAVALVNGLALVGVGRLTRHPAVRVGTACWFGAAWVLGVHLALGGVSWSSSDPGVVAGALWSAETGQALVAVVAACGLMAVWLERRQRRVLAIGYGVTSLAFAALSLVLVTWLGFGVAGDKEHVTWAYLVYAVAAFASAWCLRSSLATWVGCTLSQLAIVQLAVFVWPVPQFPWSTALLIGASVCAVTRAAFAGGGVKADVAEPFVSPLTRFAVSVSLIAAALASVALHAEAVAAFSVRGAWLSAVWLVLAFSGGRPWLMAASQVALVVAACAAAQNYLHGRAWYQTLASPLGDPWVWQVHLSVVGVLALGFAVARLLIGRLHPVSAAERDGDDSAARGRILWLEDVRRLLNPTFFAMDRWMSPLVLVGMLLLSMWSVWPAVVAEHGWQPVGASYGAYGHASGVGSWVLLMIVAVTLVVRLREGYFVLAAQGSIVALASGIALVAATFEPRHEVVSALRWLSAFALAAVSVVVWTGRRRLDGAARTIGNPAARGSVASVSPGLLLLGSFGLIVVTLTATFARALAQRTALVTAGTSDQWLYVSLLGPVVLVAGSVLGHGVRRRHAGFAVTATGVACAMVTVVELSLGSRAGARWSPVFAVWLVQLNALVCAAIALVWRALSGWTPRPAGSAKYPRWPLVIARALICSTLLLAVGAVWLRPGTVSPAVVEAGTVWGILAVVLVEWSLFSTGGAEAGTERWGRVYLWLILGAVVFACVGARLDTGNWLCFHALLVGFVAAGWLCLPFGRRRVRELIGAGWQETFEAASARTGEQAREIGHDLSCAHCAYNLRGLAPSGRCPECNTSIAESVEAAASRLTPQWAARLAQVRTQTGAGVLICTVAATLFALRAALDDPQKPWWSAAALLALSALALAFAGWAPRRKLAFVGGIEACLGVSVWWVTLHWRQAAAGFSANLADLLNVNVVALSVAGLAWIVVERRLLRRKLAAGAVGSWPAFNHTAAAVSTAVVAVLAWLALYFDAGQASIGGRPLASWTAWTAAAGLMLASAVRPASRYAPAGLYVLGLAAIGLILAQRSLAPATLAWAVSVSLAGFVLMTSMAARVWRTYGRDELATEGGVERLLAANGVVTAASVALAVYVSLTDPGLSVRMLVVTAPLLCAVGAVLLSAEDRRGLVQNGGCALVAISAVLAAWAWIRPDIDAALLHRAVGLVAAFGAMLVIGSAVMALGEPVHSWLMAVRRVGAGMSAFAAAALFYCAGYEALALANGRTVPLSMPVIVALIGFLGGMAASFIAFALRDRLDPFRLPAAARETYVYAAEGLAAVLALHVRTSMPWLFHGFITQYWPVLVMALAFAAVGGGEACQRVGARVLARPLGRTGLFLPALALLDFFLIASRVHYSIVLLTVGSLYAVLAGLRRSVALGVIAAASFNASLWYLLHHTRGLGITRHPQLWFIPPALAVLAAGYLNRARLDPKQRASLHYGCLLTVYVSSTADVFLVGVARAPWLPLVLAGLSVGGILGGIALRVRSFLQLGVGFLCLSLFTIIWHAASNLGWTWVWYVAGIALGASLITVFALFEKKRGEMTALLDDLRGWAE